LTVTGALVGLVYAIVRTETNAWLSAQTLLPLTIGAGLFVVFLLVELRLARAPLVPLRIFRSRSVAGANVFMLLLFGAMFGAFYFETLYMQGILGYSALRAGTAFLPQTVMLALAAQVASRLVTRLGSRPLLVAGTVVSAAGLAWLSQITPQSEFLTDMLGPFLLIGAGIGLCVTPVTVAGTAGVPPAEAGLASGLLNASRTVGASIGLATLATCLRPHRSVGNGRRRDSRPDACRAHLRLCSGDWGQRRGAAGRRALDGVRDALTLW
jgi:predicted MFS family arabinose efflux permease